MRQSWLWPICLILAVLVTGFMTFALPGTTLQPFVVFGFLFFCPGMAVVRFFRLDYIVAELTLAVAVSLSLEAIIAGLFMYAGHWSLSGIMETLLLLCFGCSIIQLAMLHPAFSRRLNFIALQNTIRIPMLNLTETETILLPRLTRTAPQQKDVVDRDTIFMTTIKDTHPRQSQHDQKAIEGQEDAEAIEEKATVHVPSISISYSPAPQAKPITDKQPLEEQKTQQLNISATQEKDFIEEKESAPSPDASSSSAAKEQTIEEKETVNIPSVQIPKLDLIPEQTIVNSPATETEQEEQEKKEPVIVAAKPEPSKEPQKKALSARTIIPHTNPHKAIVQEPTTKNVLRKKRLTKEAVKREDSEQDNI